MGMDMTWNSRAAPGFWSMSSLSYAVSLSPCFTGDLLQDRGDHLARAAPGGPEIDEHGFSASRTSCLNESSLMVMVFATESSWDLIRVG